MEDPLSRYYRCPAQYVDIETDKPLSAADGYFRIGSRVTGFGRYSGREPSRDPEGDLPDALDDVAIENGRVHLPFDPGQVAENLRCELYAEDWRGTLPLSLLAQVYYFVRPILPVAIRRHLQKLHLNMRSDAPFPHWPVDTSVDDMFGQVLLLALKAQRLEKLPFIWFWPDGASSAAFMTHDVETALGRDLLLVVDGHRRRLWNKGVLSGHPRTTIRDRRPIPRFDPLPGIRSGHPRPESRWPSVQEPRTVPRACS